MGTLLIAKDCSSNSSRMLKVIPFLCLVLTQLSSSSSHTISVAINVDTRNLDSSTSVATKPNQLMNGLIANLDRSYKSLASCGFPEILKCTGKIEEAAASCIQHPDVTQCITEFLGAESECMDCIKVICKALHIHGCM